MPRLFTALEIPADIAGTLAMLRGGIPGARWISPEFYHVTLRFIGDVDYAVARDVAAALDEVERFGFELTLDGVDQFGNNKPRAIFATVKANRELIELQAEQERLMKRVGLPPEGRNFRPHVTLLRNIEHATPPMDTPAPLSWRYDRMVLVASESLSGGSRYRIVAQSRPQNS